MPGHEEHDLERRLREERPEARDEFVQSLAADVHGRRSHPSARPRLTLAFALSLALLVSMIAFGGVGAAKDAVSSSTDTVKHALGDDEGEHHHHPTRKPSDDEYNTKVLICVPEVHYVYTREAGRRAPVLRRAQLPQGAQTPHAPRARASPSHPDDRLRDRARSASRVPHLVSEGAVYPVPAGGCSSLNQPAPKDSDGDYDGD